MGRNWFDEARCALLLMDFQVDVCAPGGRMVSDRPDVHARFDSAVRRAATLLSAARDSGLPVLHVRHRFSPGYPELADAPPTVGMARYVRATGAFVEGTPGAEIVEPLRRAAPSGAELRGRNVM
ncbi:MAG: isochorismatase family protein [Myxococcales bacterium]|jgi:nicotinamidase-related amidase